MASYIYQVKELVVPEIDKFVLQTEIHGSSPEFTYSVHIYTMKHTDKGDIQLIRQSVPNTPPVYSIAYFLAGSHLDTVNLVHLSRDKTLSKNRVEGHVQDKVRIDHDSLTIDIDGLYKIYSV